MITNTRLVFSTLLLCAVFISVLSSPTHRQENDKSPLLNRKKRTFDFGLFGPRDWSIHHTWRLPTFPTMPSVMNFFDDEDLHENFRRRITDLEIGQRRIIDFLRKTQADKNVPYACKGHQEPEKLPTPLPDSVDTTKEPIPETQTSTTSTTTTTTTPTTEVPSVKVDQQVPTTEEVPVTPNNVSDDGSNDNTPEVPTTIPGDVTGTTTLVNDPQDANDVFV